MSFLDRHFGIGRRIKRHREFPRGWSKLERSRIRLIDDGVLLLVCPEQRLDTLSQLRIRRTFPIENGSPLDGIRGFDGRPENGFNTFRINGHGDFLGKELTLECVVLGSRLSKKRQKLRMRSRTSKSRP